MITYADDFNTIIVRDIFNDTVFIRAFDNFEGMSTNIAFPFINAEFVDDGQRIIVTYFSGSYDEIAVTLDLT
jgi:hypothetical protein